MRYDTTSGKKFVCCVTPASVDALRLLPLSAHLPALSKDRAVAELDVPAILRLREQVPDPGVLRRLGDTKNVLRLASRDEPGRHPVVDGVENFFGSDGIFGPERC